MTDFLLYLLIGWIALMFAWLFVHLWDMYGITGYRREVLHWLDDLALEHRFDEQVMQEYYERGESSWNAAQAMIGETL